MFTPLHVDTSVPAPFGCSLPAGAPLRFLSLAPCPELMVSPEQEAVVLLLVVPIAWILLFVNNLGGTWLLTE